MGLRGYAICTAPRSGSAFLTQALASTGQLGRPYEYFNPGIRRLPGMADHPDDPHAQLAAITTRGATPNGVYGFKLFADQADRAAETRWPVVLPDLSFIHLERRDALGQALSFARARSSGQFRSTLPKGREPAYDRALIELSLRKIVKGQARWRLYFASNGLQPLHLFYEDVVRDPQAAVEQVAALIGLGEPVVCDAAQIDVEVQRDDVTVQWRERFLAEATDLDRIDAL